MLLLTAILMYFAVLAVSYALPRKLVAAAGTTRRVAQSKGRRTLHAKPSNYLSMIKMLRAGDMLVLAPGIYGDGKEIPGLPLFDLHGEPDQPIIVTGPDAGPRPVFRASAGYNTIRFKNTSYIIVRNVEVDGRQIDVDGVKAQGITHHITLENIRIQNQGNDQQTVGISTKGPAWDWIIRGCEIRGSGTGIYLGNPDGDAPFIHGLIENNLIEDTVGYNIEIKHQLPWPDLFGVPTDPSSTIIRHNVFSKAHRGSVGHMARPNVLVGHFPLSGPGKENVYVIYDNFFYENPTGEALFQGEGNIALYNNLFYNSHGDAIHIQPHNSVPRIVYVFFNTIIAHGDGIVLVGGDTRYRQIVVANVAFGRMPIQANDQAQNFVGSWEAAAQYFVRSTGQPGELDLYPKVPLRSSTPIDIEGFKQFPDSLLDFNGTPRAGYPLGAYEGEGNNPGWMPTLTLQPSGPSPSAGPL